MVRERCTTKLFRKFKANLAELAYYPGIVEGKRKRRKERKEARRREEVEWKQRSEEEGRKKEG